MTLAPALLLALLLQAQVPNDTTEIRGRVVGERGAGSQPLPYAVLEVVGPGGARTVLADDQGRYSISAGGGGQFRLSVQYLGYERTEVQVVVPAGASLPLDLVLAASPVELPPLLVTGERIFLPELEETARGSVAGGGSAELELRALEATPGLVETGLGAAAGQVPGNDPSDPTDVLFMRGSTADMKLVLLDGAPVYTPFHLGGVLRSFEAAALSSATHHVGGAPARYDGGLSYILDLRTRTPSREELRAAGALDLMSAQATVEGPLGPRASLLASTRALHGLASKLAGGAGSPYGYVDGLLRGEVGGGVHRVSFTAFGNRESVYLNPERNAEPLSAPSTESPSPSSIPEDASWGNGAVSMRYTGTLSWAEVELGAAATRYRAELPFPLASDSTGPSSDTVSLRGDGMLAIGETGRLRLTADLLRPLASGSLRAGASFDRMNTEVSAWRLSTGPGGSLGYQGAAVGTVVGAYLDGLHEAAPGLDLHLGLRLDRFDPGGTKGALRLALLWKLTEEARLGITVGRYHQLSRSTDADVDLQLGDGTTAGTGGVPSTADPALLSVARSDHLVLSLDQRLTPSVHLGLEGYFKSFAGLSGVQQQDLNASGLDLRLLREGDRLTGWLGYSLSWFWENPDALGRSQEFVGRHLLSAGIRSRPLPDWGLDLELAYSEGLPLTSIPFSRSFADEFAPASAGGQTESPSTSAVATDAFLRMDAELFAELEPRWGGRTLEVRPYLRLLNALNRRDALFYYFEPWRDPGLRPLAELSVIPVLGVEWRF